MSIDLEVTFSALASETRCQILFLVLEGNVIHETDLLPRMSKITRRREISIYHKDLPKLDDEDLINWDEKTGAISRGESFADVEPLLEFLEEEYGISGTLLE